jgi:SAM-dependent methyltransferase
METLEELTRAGQERLYPALTNPNWLVLRRRRQLLQDWLKTIEDRELLVLDVGGRIQPYRPLLEGRTKRYIAVDLRQTMLVDIVCGAEAIPLASGLFDLVICSQVLEYIEKPQSLITEIHRVLKPGGYLWLSAPSVFPRDSDEDLWRFLPGSLRLLLWQFRDVRITAECSSIEGFFRTVSVCLVMFAKPAFLSSPLRFVIVPILNVSAMILQLILKSSNDQFCPNFSAFARK